MRDIEVIVATRDEAQNTDEQCFFCGEDLIAGSGIPGVIIYNPIDEDTWMCTDCARKLKRLFNEVEI
jgi:hypothetical protein